MRLKILQSAVFAVLQQLSLLSERSIDHGKEICFPSGMDRRWDRLSKKLYDTLTGIQMGRIEAPEGMDPRNRVITGFSSLYITLSTKKQTAVFFSVVCFFIISSLFFCTKRAFSFCFMICAHITYLFSRISQTHIPDQSMSVLHSPL